MDAATLAAYRRLSEKVTRDQTNHYKAAQQGNWCCSVQSLLTYAAAALDTAADYLCHHAVCLLGCTTVPEIDKETLQRLEPVRILVSWFCAYIYDPRKASAHGKSGDLSLTVYVPSRAIVIYGLSPYTSLK